MKYPYEDGDVIVLGPEIFVSKDKSVISWKGENYTVQPPPDEGTKRETLALGWLSAHFAGLADAWNGNAPDWFPEPPEWLDLWDQALKATQDELNKH